MNVEIRCAASSIETNLIRRLFCRHRRPGSALLTTQLVVIAMLIVGCVIFESGRLVVGQSELQGAADAGALAGINRLDDGDGEVVVEASHMVASNVVSGKGAYAGALDVTTGHWDPRAATFTPKTDTDKTINAVRVHTHACSDHGNQHELLTGQMLGMSGGLNLHADAIAYRAAANPPKGFVGLDRFRSRGVLTTASVDPGEAPPLLGLGDFGGHIHSNGNVQLHVLGLAGASHINGDVMAGGNLELPAISLLTKITGRTGRPSAVYELPPVDPRTARRDNDNDSLSSTNFDGENLTFAGVTSLDSGTYHVNDLTVLAGAIVNIRGPVTIVVTGRTTVLGSVLSFNRDARDFRLLVASDDKINLAATADLYLDLYAPESQVQITGGLRYTGRIAAKEIDILVSTLLYADHTLGDPLKDTAPIHIVH